MQCPHVRRAWLGRWELERVWRERRVADVDDLQHGEEDADGAQAESACDEAATASKTDDLTGELGTDAGDAIAEYQGD